MLWGHGCVCMPVHLLLWQPVVTLCETLRRALSHSGRPIHGNYTHLISSCEKVGGHRPNDEVLKKRGQGRLFILHFFMFYLFPSEREGRHLFRALCKRFTVSVGLCVGWEGDSWWIVGNRGVVIECLCVYSAVRVYSLWLTAQSHYTVFSFMAPALCIIEPAWL